MEELVKAAPVEIAEVENAKRLAELIDSEISGAVDGERKLDQRWAHVGVLLSQFEKSEGFKLIGFESFPRYLLSLKEKYGRSNGQLWAYKEVAAHLGPTVGEAALDTMGVSKAFEIARAVKKADKPVTPELVAAALDPKTTVKEVRALAHKIFELQTEEAPKGTWMDLGGFYAAPEERKLLMETYDMGAVLLELPKNTPEWAKRKAVHLAMAQEFHGTHMTEVYGPGAPAEEPPPHDDDDAPR